ncbi:MAG: CRISPR-associated helicase Cas3' [Chloroflexota bacterium]
MAPDIMSNFPKFYSLWAKTHSGDGGIHLLIYHMVDVAEVFLKLWELALPESIRSQFGHDLNLKEDETKALLSFWISLHDIGKASPAFQQKYPPMKDVLIQKGFKLQTEGSYIPMPHALVSAWVLEKLFVQAKMPPRPSKRLARALGGHHGVWPTSDQLSSPQRSSNLGDKNWDESRYEIFQALTNLFKPPAFVHLPEAMLADNVFMTLFSGLTVVADWIGSMENYFIFEGNPQPLQQYAELSAQRADLAIKSLGWSGWLPNGKKRSFSQMFPKTPVPNDIQLEVFAVAEEIQPPVLAIIEAPTGTGKTEMAFLLADRWLQTDQGRGIYIAMPTMATSNQMFERTRRFLEESYPNDFVNLHLAHSQALFSENVKEMILSQIGEDSQGQVAAASWFLPRKRTLLAPFGVGTVDQALLSVLQTHHFFVRLFGLTHKVVIFDEIHAYDTYMSALFQRLLAWLGKIGTSVILLSATLPEGTRRQLVEAYTGTDYQPPETVAYPRLTVAHKEHTDVLSLPVSASRSISLEQISYEPQAIVAVLREKMKLGGCAAVICNTVNRAQSVYAAIRQVKIVPDEDCILFHARFPYSWRMEKEDHVLKRFGKNASPPRKSAIVVATQVIEQSLDLDFDLMISDLAPIDLIIQRAGRLQRHARSDRPFNLQKPVLVLALPEQGEQGLPLFENERYVYEPYLLLRSWMVLRDKKFLNLPQDTAALIEEVYGEKDDKEEFFKDELERTLKKMTRQQELEIDDAKKRLILPPGHEDLLGGSNKGLKEDHAEVHQVFQALTRYAMPGMSLVCLHRLADGSLVCDPQNQETRIDLEEKISHETIELLLKQSVSVMNRGLVRYFTDMGQPKTWQQTAALYNHFPVIFQGGTHLIEKEKISLHLSHEYGLQIQKEVA